MDIQRPASVARQKKMRRILFAVVGVIVIGVVSVVLARLKPAAPTVERATVWVDTVKRGRCCGRSAASARSCRSTKPAA